MRYLSPVKFLSLFLAVLVPLSWGAASTDRKSFSTTPTLAAEAAALIKLLEDQHYNSSAVRSLDYAQVVPDYMEDLDSQRLFFLATDQAAFAAKYGRNVYYNTAFLGNIDAAYEIYYVYQKRVEERVAWIMGELAKEIDFNAKETYEIDRSKLPWPESPAVADDLWRRRLKYELIGELLNKKTNEEAVAAVRKRYERMLKNVHEMEGNDLAEIYLSAIARLFDPHSSYFSPETFEDFSIQMKLQLVGIGAQLVMEDDTCVVREIIPGGPADLGRELKANDKIVSVAQAKGEPVDVIGMRLTKIVELIRGEKGTQVHLTVQPADSTDPAARKEIVITRDKVKINSSRARAAVFQLPGQDGATQPIGVITLPAFYGPADDGDTDAEKTTASMDVARLIARLKEEKVQGLVLDLRRNGGGYLNEAIELAGLFIKQGPVVQVKASDGGIEVANDQDEKIAYTGPLAVLVDRFSASASEIVAGALQNYGRAIIVGDNSTHGKGSVQTIIEMRRMPQLFRSKAKTGAAKFTIQKYYLPSGASTQLKGVVPDIVLPSVDEFIPNIGEASLPRAMVWDKIPTSFFDGEPLEPAVLTPLREASLKRQAESEDFAYLKKSVDRFKARQEMKAISVNLDDRKQLKADDDAFRKEMRAERAHIAESDFPFQPFYLGPPPPPKTKPPKINGEDDPDFDPTENETYTKADVHLREALRVVNDAVNLGREPKRWANNRAPLTATGG